MFRYLFILLLMISIFSCNNDASQNAAKQENTSYDAVNGEGKFSKVVIAEKLDIALAEKGQHVFEAKCIACHKRTDEKLVGPGLMDVTKRHTAAWILNFLTNTDFMLNKDPKLQAQMEQYKIRMPDTEVSEEEAKSIYEFLRRNDGVK